MKKQLDRFFEEMNKVDGVASVTGDFIPISKDRGGGEVFFLNAILDHTKRKSLKKLRNLSQAIAREFFKKYGTEAICISLLRTESEGLLRVYRIEIAAEKIKNIRHCEIESIGIMEQSRDVDIAKEILLDQGKRKPESQ